MRLRIRVRVEAIDRVRVEVIGSVRDKGFL